MVTVARYLHLIFQWLSNQILVRVFDALSEGGKRIRRKSKYLWDCLIAPPYSLVCENLKLTTRGYSHLYRI